MSWSFQAIGTPEKIAAALEANSERISSHPEDRSRAEFDEAKPHLIALVKMNSGSQQVAINIVANGSASWTHTGEKVSSTCYVKIESMYGLLT